MPKVSVIVPNYNYRRYLARRIDSIITQTYQDVEIILLDDSSTDGSQELLRQYETHPLVSKALFNRKKQRQPVRTMGERVGFGKRRIHLDCRKR